MITKPFLLATALLGTILIGAGAYKLLSSNIERIEPAQTSASMQAPETINVPLNIPWTVTGITIKKGQTLIVRASGKGIWKNTAQNTPNSYPKSFEECDPDGTPPVDAADYYSNIEAYTTKDAYKGSLIGKIGGSGKPFKVGSSFNSVSSVEGVLFLGINEMRQEIDPTAFADNSGYYNVQVTLR